MMNGTINELKQGLLKCAKENENRTYLTGQVVISSICESAKDTIEELEKENQKLQQQIGKMKCCENCKHHSFWGNELKCNLLDSGVEFECLKSKNKWELAE